GRLQKRRLRRGLQTAKCLNTSARIRGSKSRFRRHTEFRTEEKLDRSFSSVLDSWHEFSSVLNQGFEIMVQKALPLNRRAWFPWAQSLRVARIARAFRRTANPSKTQA